MIQFGGEIPVRVSPAVHRQLAEEQGPVRFLGEMRVEEYHAQPGMDGAWGSSALSTSSPFS